MGYDKFGNRIKTNASEPTQTTPKTKYIPNPNGIITLSINGNVPSSKNSKQFRLKKNKDGTPVKNPATGKNVTLLRSSDAVLKYKKNAQLEYELQAKKFKGAIERNGIKFPIKVEMFFERKTKGRWDFHNMIQIVADMMVKHGWVPDDDVESLLIYPPIVEPYFSVNPKQPKVHITLLK